jgi:hypothetical protein
MHMSFLDNLTKMAGQVLGNATPEQTADAAASHVAGADPSETADHLLQSIPNMNSGSLMALGQQLLSTYTQHPSYPGDANTATQEAGVTQDAVAAGDQGAVATMIAFAKNHPEILQTAATAFMQKNPSALTSLAPGLLQGIMGKLGGGAA